MSTRDVPVSRLNQEQLRKRAKDLRKARGAADPAASERATMRKEESR